MFYTQSTTSLLLGLQAATLGLNSFRNLLEDYKVCQDQWGHVLFNFLGVDNRRPRSPSPAQPAAERCPSAVCKLQVSAGGKWQWAKGAQFGRMLTQPCRTSSDKISKSQQFVSPAEPRWMAGVRFRGTTCNPTATSCLENTAVKGEKRRAMRERIKAVQRAVVSLIIGAVGKWRKERRGFFLSYGFFSSFKFCYTPLQKPFSPLSLNFS